MWLTVFEQSSERRVSVRCQEKLDRRSSADLRYTECWLMTVLVVVMITMLMTVLFVVNDRDADDDNNGDIDARSSLVTTGSWQELVQRGTIQRSCDL